MFTYKALSGCLLLHGMQAVSLQFVTYEVSRYVSDKRLMDVIYDLLESFTDFWYFEGFWECTDPYVMDLDYILLCLLLTASIIVVGVVTVTKLAAAV